MNILTFDVEEWFHIRFDDAFLNNIELLKSFEKRLDNSIEIILDLLDRHNQKATFFCLGWVAREYPHVIKEIDYRGHEIGCHSDSHKLLYNFTQEEFEQDLVTAITSIKSITGKDVKFYRVIPKDWFQPKDLEWKKNITHMTPEELASKFNLEIKI